MESKRNVMLNVNVRVNAAKFVKMYQKLIRLLEVMIKLLTK